MKQGNSMPQGMGVLPVNELPGSMLKEEGHGQQIITVKPP